MGNFDIITEREAATMLRLSTKTLSRMRKTGQVPYLPGKPVRYIKQALLDEMTSRLIPATRDALVANPRTARLPAMRSLSTKRAIKAALLS